MELPDFFMENEKFGSFVRRSEWKEILISSDGTNWTQRTFGLSNRLNGVTYGNGLFVTVGGIGTNLTSSDGTSWTQKTTGTSKVLHRVTYGNGLFVTVGEEGIILTSSDGTSWKRRTSGTSETLTGITYSQ